MIVKISATDRETEIAFTIRKAVFVDEQQVPIELEMDEHDDEAIHFVCYDDNEPIGASRLRFAKQYGKLERICILKEHRGKQHGQQLIKVMETNILNNGYLHAKLNAQTHAEGFYKRLGYETISEEFMDAGIPHITMVKKL